MPNIIINNYCNQKCNYCFAYKNMKDAYLQKDMDIITYIKILKYLKINKQKEVRLLGGEPLLSPNIRTFIKIANKGGFNTILFSNINIKYQDIVKIFEGINFNNTIKINCNINSYNKNIKKNIKYLQSLGINIILGYNITNTTNNSNFIFNLAEKHNIKYINIKLINSLIGGKLIIDNSSRKLGIYIFNIIKKYHRKFFLEFSCGLNKNIFNKNEIDYIKNKTNIKLKYGCFGNIGKFDINTNGTPFKCYPLFSLFRNKFNINILLQKKIKIKKLIKELNKGLMSDGECTANKIIKRIN